MTPTPTQRALLPTYFAFVYGLLLYLNAGTMDFATAEALGWGGMLFALNAYLSYNLIYLAPALLLTWLAGRGWRQPARAQQARLVAAALGGGLTSLFFHANARLFELYGMFVNGFVVNLIVTPGGIESLGGSDASNVGFMLIAVGFLLGHTALLLGLRYLLPRLGRLPWNGRKLGKVVLLGFLLSTVTDRAVYAYADAYGKSDLMVLTQGVPYYVGFTARTFLRRLGFQPIRQHKAVRFQGEMQYPAKPIRFGRPARPYNIVWLVAESWRADTLDPEIMPVSWDFARQAQNFRLHYSGGNGTRIGVFTMMTGVPGNYWEPFLQARRSAPIIDVLQQQDYQMAFYTSARFSYPEFDQTLFSKVPKDALHEIDGPGAGWEKDRKNVGDMLKFIDQRDPARPFFTWMFFESPHARYYFPPESAIRKPYRDDINYATLDKSELKEDIDLIRNRYLNAVHHLDSQYARVIDYLKAHHLLDNTIVVMVGDHGEEFMEHGFWGHNSTFTDPQTRTPLVLWIPGVSAASHDKLTSHLDIVPTLMPLLGVRNPVEDYAVGYDLLGPEQREHVLLADWSRVCYRDRSVKIILPINVAGGVGRKVTGPGDEPLSADEVEQYFRGEQPHLVRMMQDLGRFNKSSPKS